MWHASCCAVHKIFYVTNFVDDRREHSANHSSEILLLLAIRAYYHPIKHVYSLTALAGEIHLLVSLRSRYAKYRGNLRVFHARRLAWCVASGMCRHILPLYLCLLRQNSRLSVRDVARILQFSRQTPLLHHW